MSRRDLSIEPVRFLSVFSGIEAASLAFAPLGWRAAGFAEIDPFACAVLAARHGSNLPGEPFPPDGGVPNFGDVTKIPVGGGSPLGRIDVLCGGSPCQSFSFAGKRGSLADARGNLTLAFVDLAHGLADHHGLHTVFWENVPGVLSTSDNAFGCFLGGLVGADGPLAAGGKWPGAGMVAGPRARAAWRVLDAQHFGVPQRRKRVFLVADFGAGADPAAVLFEPKGLCGDSAPRVQARQDIAGYSGARAALGCGDGADGAGDVACFGGGRTSGALDVAATLTAKGQRIDFDVETFVAHALRGEGFDASEDGTGRGTPIVPCASPSRPTAVAFDLRGRAGGALPEGPHDTANLRAASGGSSRSYIAFSAKDYGADAGELAPTLRSGGHRDSHANAGVMPAVALPSYAGDGGAQGADHAWAVRRLTPRECERLQGFPDDYTAIARGGKSAADCPDGPRYRALGNSWAVPVVAWLGARMGASLRARRRP